MAEQDDFELSLFDGLVSEPLQLEEEQQPVQQQPVQQPMQRLLIQMQQQHGQHVHHLHLQQERAEQQRRRFIASVELSRILAGSPNGELSYIVFQYVDAAVIAEGTQFSVHIDVGPWSKARLRPIFLLPPAKVNPSHRAPRTVTAASTAASAGAAEPTRSRRGSARGDKRSRAGSRQEEQEENEENEEQQRQLQGVIEGRDDDPSDANDSVETMEEILANCKGLNVPTGGLFALTFRCPAYGQRKLWNVFRHDNNDGQGARQCLTVRVVEHAHPAEEQIFPCGEWW